MREGKILLIHRHRMGDEYYVIPGGGVDHGETPEQAAIRELKEETDLEVEVGEILSDFVNQRGWLGPTRSITYLARSAKGEATFGPGAPESGHQSNHNRYRLEWVELADVSKLHLVPDQLKQDILKKLS